MQTETSACEVHEVALSDGIPDAELEMADTLDFEVEEPTHDRADSGQPDDADRR